MIGLAALPGGARHEHDAAASLELTRRRARRVEHRVHVLVHRATPVLVRHVRQRDVVRRPDAGVSDEDVEATELANGAVEQRRRSRDRGQVGSVCERTHAEPCQLLHDVRRLRLTRAIPDADVRSAFRQQQRSGAANAARPAGDERALAAKVDHVELRFDRLADRVLDAEVNLLRAIRAVGGHDDGVVGDRAQRSAIARRERHDRARPSRFAASAALITLGELPLVE